MEGMGEWLKRPGDFVLVPTVGLGAAHLEHVFDLVAGEPIGPATVAWGAMLVALGIKRLTWDRRVDRKETAKVVEPLSREIDRNISTMDLEELELTALQDLALSDLIADFQQATEPEELRVILERSRKLRDEILGDE